MKLHLPHRLFAALIALMPLSQAYTVETGPAVYGRLTASEVCTAETEETGKAAFVTHTILQDATSQDWVFEVTGRDVGPKDEGVKRAYVIGIGEVTTTDDGDSWKNEADDDWSFNLMILPDGDIVINLTNKQHKNQNFRLKDFSARGWTRFSEISGVFAYNAKRDTLSFLGGVAKAGSQSFSLTPYQNLNYDVPKNFLSETEDTDFMQCMVSSAGSSVTTKLYTQGNETGWTISGVTDLQGTYTDSTSDDKDAKIAIQDGQAIQFVGEKGVLYSNTTATLNSEIEAVLSLERAMEGTAMGFGAAAGETLTLEKAAANINDASGNAFVDKLNIVGDGTVKLVYKLGNAADLRNVELNISDNATLELNYAADADPTDAQVDLTNGTFSQGSSIICTGIEKKFEVNLGEDDPTAVVSMNRIENTSGAVNISGVGSLKVNTLAAGGDILVKNKTVASESVSATGEVLVLSDASLKTLDMTAGLLTVEENGVVTVVGDTVVTDEVFVDGTLNLASAQIDGDTSVYGTMTFDTLTVEGDTVVEGTLSGGDAELAETVVLGKLVADSLKAGELVALENGVINAVSVAADVVDAGGILVTSASTDEPILADGVSISVAGIDAGSVGEGVTIEIAPDAESTLIAGKIAEADVIVDGQQVFDALSTDSVIELTAGGAAAEGSLTAESIDIQNGYTISAQQVNAAALAVGDSTLTEVSLDKLESLSVAEIVADSVTAESADIDDFYSITANKIAVTDMLVGDGVSINNAVITDSNVKAGQNLALKNVTLGSGSVMAADSMTFDNVTVTVAFGGADGDSFRLADGVDSLVITGGSEGDDITLSRVVVNAEELDFSGTDENNQKTYNILLADGATSFGDYELYIQSYTRAQLQVVNGNIVLSGYTDTEGVRNEMTDTANRKNAMVALEEILNEGGEADVLSTQLGHVSRYGVEERRELLSAISGASVTALADSQRRGLQDVQHNLRNRIIQMGGGTNAGLTTDWDYVGLQAWGQADAGFISTDGSGDEYGYDYNTWGGTVGFNVDLTANVVVGMAFSAAYGELDVDSADKATGNNDAYYLNLFARYQKNRWVQMLIITFGSNDMDMDRKVGSYTGSGSTEGSSLSAYYEVGYTVGLNYEFTHILQPMLSFSIASAKVDGYTETGSIGNTALKYDGDSFVYGTVGIGARYQGVMYESVHERNAVLEARAIITKDFGDATDEAMVAIGNSELYKVNGADSTGAGFELGAGVSIPVEQHTTLYADADVTFRPDSTAFRGNIGLRFDF